MINNKDSLQVLKSQSLFLIIFIITSHFNAFLCLYLPTQVTNLNSYNYLVVTLAVKCLTE